MAMADPMGPEPMRYPFSDAAIFSLFSFPPIFPAPYFLKIGFIAILTGLCYIWLEAQLSARELKGN